MSDLLGQNVCIRSYSAGVFIGKLVEENQSDQVVILEDVRRIWHWSGANSLSELCVKGVSDPDNCNFPVKVKKIKIFEVIEIIQVTKEAMENIDAVPNWESKN